MADVLIVFLSKAFSDFVPTCVQEICLCEFTCGSVS